MPSPNLAPAFPAFPAFEDAERALGERLRKLAAETDQLEGYQQPHAVRLAQLAAAVGRSCGLHSSDLTALKLAALAHDLGERKMKREYLRRPSQLNWEEQLDLWRHPILGEQEAQELKLPRQAQLLVRWHHEWWNGAGYPDGLAGAAIPLGARILRAVDTYCALTADRPYRGAHDATLAEQKLAEQAGIECDPRVVQALLAILAEERYAAEMQAATTAQQSFETVPMDVVTIGALDELPVPAPTSNVIEMPLRATLFPTAPANAATLAEKLADAPTEAFAPNEAPPPAPPPPVSFDSPTLRPGGKPPAPPKPPPSPLWARLSPHELNSSLPLAEDAPALPSTSSPASSPAPVNDAPHALPLDERTPLAEAAAFTAAHDPAPKHDEDLTEEIPALTIQALIGHKALSSSLGLGSFLPEPTPAAALPLTLVPASNLQVIALSEVPDHFWLVAKWIYEEWWETPDNSISVVSNALKEHLASTTVPQTFVALIDGQPVGAISLVENDVSERAELTPWLSSLYVLPAQRGQGIGSRLLEGAFTRAKLQNAEAVYLATPGHTDFFARLGWQTLERDIGPQRLTVMTRVL